MLSVFVRFDYHSNSTTSADEYHTIMASLAEPIKWKAQPRLVNHKALVKPAFVSYSRSAASAEKSWSTMLSISYSLPCDQRDLFIAYASIDQVYILDRIHELFHHLSFSDAFPASNHSQSAIACVAVGTTSDQTETLVAAAIDNRVAIWTVSTSSPKKSKVHSTLVVNDGDVTCLDIKNGLMLIGSTTSLSLWHLETSAIGIWRPAWTKPSPAPIHLARFSPEASSIAAFTDRGHNVLVWLLPRGPHRIPQLHQHIYHPYPISFFTWRQPPDKHSQSDVLITYTQDAVARIWAIVIDEPTKLRLWTTLSGPLPNSGHPVDLARTTGLPRSNATEAFYLDAKVMSDAFRSNINALEVELQMIELWVGTDVDPKDAHAIEIEADIKRTRLRRLEQLLNEAPDMFLSFHPDGSLVVTAVANIDRRPPTLLQTFTVLKVPFTLSFDPKHVTSVCLLPLYVGIEESSKDSMAVIRIQLVSGSSVSLGLNPALFFDGRGQGLEERASDYIQHQVHVPDESAGLIPQYHPTFIQQALLWNKLELVKTILSHLYKSLVAYSPEHPLDTWDFEQVPDEQIWSSEREMHGHTNALTQNGHANAHSLFDDDSMSLDESSQDQLSQIKVDLLLDKLDGIKIPYVGVQGCATLRTLVKIVGEAEKESRSMDQEALRYLIALRLLLDRQENACFTTDGLLKGELDYCDFVWAFHSDTQEPLLNAIETASHQRLTWPVARSLGLFMWLKNHAAIRAQAETVARAQFSVGEDRDPVKCSLLYFALGKAKVVLGLWKQAVWHPEQKKMLQFLFNDFEEERWKTAAQKNAFALLSQRRYEFAASFFMLGDSLRDAVNVCVCNLNDVGLAIAIARIKEGCDDGPVFTELLKTKVLPMAFEQSQRWLGSWAFWMLKRRDLAVRMIVAPLAELRADAQVSSLLPTDTKVTTNGRFKDSSLAILFRKLKFKSLQTLKGSNAISEKMEFDFVLEMNRVLLGIGCPLLGLNLLRNWMFEPAVIASATTQYHKVSKQDLENLSMIDSSIAEEEDEPCTISSGGLVSSPTRIRKKTSQISITPPSSPRVNRRRSSLLRRRSSILNDLNLDNLQQQNHYTVSSPVSPPPPPPLSATTMLTNKSSLQLTKPQEESSNLIPSSDQLKLKGLGVFKSSAASNVQQGAQEFDFSQFGF